MGTLAEIHTAPGLPRGRGRLSPDEVGRAQRERLLRAMTAAVAERGYAAVRIGDVVARARVSRQSFYAQFPDKESCFLAAHQVGVALILHRLGRWAGADAPADPRRQVGGAIREYLALADEEPEFARCMLVELQAAGAAGLRARLDAHRRITLLVGEWHRRTRAADPAWPAIPESRYAAAVGAVHDLLFAAVAEDRPARTVQDAAVDAVLALLQAP